jgi:hypothetical protein
MNDVKRTTQISSNIGRGCEHCGHGIGALDDGDVSDGINHYIEEHGYHLLHVGQETNHGPDGKPWHNTVAVLGHANPPALRPPAKTMQLPEDMKSPRAGTAPIGTGSDA